MSSGASTSAGTRAFPPTRWSVVLAAQQPQSAESAAALEVLCRAYWYPLYAYVRRAGQSAHDAQDLTQEFFCRLIERHWLDAADREKGKLRTFLIVALKKFMSNEWRRASAERRGGGRAAMPLDTVLAESRYAADNHSLAPDDAFDQQWALTLLDLTVNRLRDEFAAAGKPGEFDLLKGCLMAERGALDYAGMAARLGVTEGAARVAAHRLRKRFRQLYREEIAQTLAAGTDPEAEMRHLAAALARQ
ncbi:MAG TPA: sigma-70 family RNA polymerase sigma factor [Candidatus Acidoferrum sp.]|nr:sigma-70 family RNA polymerase sigma factor [Candidatus Acidoferrum sp.]